MLGCGYSTEPGRQAHTGSGGLRYAAKILYEIMLAGFLCLTKPAFMRRPWRITPCPAVLGWAFLCFVGIISTVSRQLRYSPSRACVCLPARVPYAVALFTFLSLCPRLLPWARSVRACYSFTLSPRLLPRDRSVRADYLCMLCPVSAGLAWICSPFARVFSGLAQHHIECHHEAEAHHKCYGGAV